MKKLIIGALFLIPFATFGAVQVAKEIKSYDFVASVNTVKQDTVYVYKYEDKSTDCFVSVMYFGMSGGSHSISCVKR